ncbi:hypothetical protein LCGC14_0730730 [marine sediment metagenome]|uniref:Uncharacterized protein n=1 Tax=marine sediment metagenome TaxID=412755 RepID=A0A0F9QDP5_9ZZZZ
MYTVTEAESGKRVASFPELRTAKEMVALRPEFYFILDEERGVTIFTEDGGMTWESEDYGEESTDPTRAKWFDQQPESRAVECPNIHGPGICRLCEA